MFDVFIWKYCAYIFLSSWGLQIAAISLTNGLDDIGLTLRQADKIKAFEAQRLATKPWLAHSLNG